MFLLLVKRVAELCARPERSDEEELDCLIVIDAYEAKRWPTDTDIYRSLAESDQTDTLPRT